MKVSRPDSGYERKTECIGDLCGGHQRRENVNERGGG